MCMVLRSMHWMQRMSAPVSATDIIVAAALAAAACATTCSTLQRLVHRPPFKLGGEVFMAHASMQRVQCLLSL